MHSLDIKRALTELNAAEPNQLALGTDIEKEHKGTIEKTIKDTEKGNPPPTEAVQAGIAKDHIKENDSYYQKSPGVTKDILLVPKSGSYVLLAAALKGKQSSQYFHNKLLLKAISRESEFRKEVPEQIKRIVDKDPARANEFSQQMGKFWDAAVPGQGASQGQAYKKYLQDQMKQQQVQKEPMKETLRKSLLGLQPQVNPNSLSDKVLLTNANAMLQENPNNWQALADFIGPQLTAELQKHTLYNPKTLLTDLSKSNGDLKALFTTDNYLK